jgi:RNA polymerase sigma factor (sigma-70 family)
VEGDVAHLSDFTAAPQARTTGPAAARTQEDTGCAELGAAAHAVTALYRSHALALTRLAFIVLGDCQSAEDVVQEAFCGLFRAWDRLPADANVLGYLRVSVVNGCRTMIRRSKRTPRAQPVPPAPSAEASMLVGEERRATVAALRRLPPRQREALVLRYFADLPEQGPVVRNYQPRAVTSVDLIDTLAPGGTLAAGRFLVLRPPAGESAPTAAFITPDGTKLIGGTGKSDSPPTRGPWTGELSVYAARTGTLLQRLAPWKWNGLDRRPAHGGFPKELIAWSNTSGSRLILLHPVDDLNILGVATSRGFRATGTPLPQAPGYQELEYALRTASQMVW